MGKIAIQALQRYMKYIEVYKILPLIIHCNAVTLDIENG